MPLKSGPTLYGDFDFKVEFDKLCACPTYAHVFKTKPPSLAVYNAKKGTCRGHSVYGMWHVHLTIGPFCRKGSAKVILAHELAHLVCDSQGFVTYTESGRGRHHSAAFDEVLRVLVREGYEVDLPVGERNGRYDYTWRLEEAVCKTGFGNPGLLRRTPPEKTRTNEKHQPKELWGWTIKDDVASVKLRVNQAEIIGYMFEGMYFGPGPKLEGNILSIPLQSAVVTNFCRTLYTYMYSNNGKIEADLAKRVREMYRCVEQEQASRPLVINI